LEFPPFPSADTGRLHAAPDNASPEPVSVRIEGLPDGEYEHIVSTEGAMNQVGVWKTVEDGVTEMDLDGDSVNVLNEK